VNYGNAINLSATITGGISPYTIGWSGPNSFSSSVQNPSIGSVTSANAGLYTSQVSDTKGCSTSNTTYVAVKSAWIYIHDKNINEESSSNFTFTLTDNSGNTLKTFLPNDSPGSTLYVYDIGAGHDDGAGYAVGNCRKCRRYFQYRYCLLQVIRQYQLDSDYRNNGNRNRPSRFKSIVYVNSSGDGYYYNAETSTKIFDHSTSHGGLTLTASDIAYGGGKIALRSTTGRVLLYTGNFSTQILQ
jgi:hypothetical protein